jgi:DNA-binding Lrp family transcriptional regulator
MTAERSDIETDPVLRSDPLWSALEKATLALTEEPGILHGKKPEWEEGLNSDTINRLANEAGLSRNNVYERGEELEGAVVIERWLKVFHPDLEEPVRVTTWHRYSLKRESKARIDRLVSYLRAWQERRAEQLRRAAQSDGAFEERRSERVAKKHVFLSYCHDNAKEVGKLRDDLIAAGEAVWWDKDILPGEDWKFAIRQAMKNSYAVVFCFSKETEAREESGMFPEARDAIAAYRKYAPGSIFLIPVRLSKCTIPPFEIDDTEMLDDLQYVDLFPAAKWSAGLQRLIQALQATPHHP